MMGAGSASPFFSVVIPTFNRAERLRSTLKSVLDQTFPDFEVLVMDDGSTDHTRAAVETLSDERVRYSWAENSGGPATPRNRGIDEAGAQWICFLDADDSWYPQKLEETRKAIESDPSCDAICNDEYVVFSREGRRARLSHGPYEPDFYRAMLESGNRCSTSAMSVRKAFLDKHDLRFNTAADYVIVEDYDLWLRMAMAGARFRFSGHVLGEYLIEEDNISLDTEKSLHNLEVLLRDHVFRIQAFEADKDLLWRRVSVRLSVARARRLLSSARHVAAFMLSLRTFVDAPGATAKYLATGLKKALKSSSA